MESPKIRPAMFFCTENTQTILSNNKFTHVPVCGLQVLLNILPRLMMMHMAPLAPKDDSGGWRENGSPFARRRRSSVGLIAKAEEYMLRTARSELMFARLKKRDGLMATALQKIRKCVCVCVCVCV